MGFGCPICSEKLDKLPGDAQSRGSRDQGLNISATPCGHMFHAYCIQKWLTGNLASSKQCPCCRKDVPKLRCLSLYPTTFEDSILDDSFSATEGQVPFPCNHGEIISSLKKQISKLENEQKEKDQLAELLSADFTALQTRFDQERASSDMWMIKAKEYESYRDLANQFETRMKRTEGQLKNYTQIEMMLRGVETSVQEELLNFPPTLESIRSLLEMKHILSADLRSTSKKLEEFKTNFDVIRNEKSKLKVQLDKKVKEYNELQNVYETSRINGRIGSSTSPIVIAGSSRDADTPKAFRVGKRSRFQEPVTSTSLLSCTDAGVDSDVDVFKPGAGSKKVKSKKPKADPKNASSGGSALRKDTETNDFSATARFKKDIYRRPDDDDRGTNGNKFQCFVSPIRASEHVENSVDSRNKTINLSSDSNADSDGDVEDFKIRGSIPGAPLPLDSLRLKSLKSKSEQPVLGLGYGSSSRKKFNFKSKK